MNCDDIQKGIYVYLDDEFAEPERIAFEDHARACPRCRNRVERERAFITRFRSNLPAIQAPEGFEARIRAALAAAPAPEQGRQAMGGTSTLTRVTLMAAAVTLVAVPSIAAWRLTATPSPAGEERVASEALATHQEDLPMEVRGSQRQIRQFLEANVPFKVEMPPVDDPRVELLGARLTRVDGREAVLLNYEIDGERLTILQVAAPAATAQKSDAPPTFSSQSGFEIATFKKRGVMSSVVGSAPSNVQRIVRAAWVP
jgi:anti-sigma factor RsiW